MDTPHTAVDGLGARLHRYLLELPLIVVLILVGFIFEALLCWPFALLCRLHEQRREP